MASVAQKLFFEASQARRVGGKRLWVYQSVCPAWWACRRSRQGRGSACVVPEEEPFCGTTERSPTRRRTLTARSQPRPGTQDAGNTRPGYSAEIARRASRG